MTKDGRSDEARDATAVAIEDLGRRAFAPVHRAMLELAGSIQRGEGSGKVWLVEHDSVLTAGRATPKDELGEGVVSIERGGRVTWHGPGQLVIYPIVRLPQRDAGAWLRALERFGVDVCASFGLTATASDDGTGVFVAGRKLASIGVALRRWVNLHGIAINVDVAPDAFAGIRPCGRSPDLMSDLSRALARKVTLDECKAAARKALPRLLGL